MFKFYVKSNNIAVVKTMNGKGFFKADIKQLETMKETASQKAKIILSKIQREIRRTEKTKLESKKIDNEISRNTWKLLKMSADEIRIATFENSAGKSNGKELGEGNRNLANQNRNISIKGIA